MTHPRLIESLKKAPTRGNTGAMREHQVIADLLGKGYEVFRSCGPNSFADLVVRMEDNICFVEVRSVTVAKNGDIVFSKKAQDKCDLYAGLLNGQVVYSDKLYEGPTRYRRSLIDRS